jgi:hypothetical protein
MAALDKTTGQCVLFQVSFLAYIAMYAYHFIECKTPQRSQTVRHISRLCITCGVRLSLPTRVTRFNIVCSTQPFIHPRSRHFPAYGSYSEAQNILVGGEHARGIWNRRRFYRVCSYCTKVLERPKRLALTYHVCRVSISLRFGLHQSTHY